MEKRENFSGKRLAILKALQETDQHPTADWIYARLKPRYPDLSLGTVYRNLKRFCLTGKAASVGVIGGQEHFDGCVGPHAHFICEKCGAVLDVPGAVPEERELSELSHRMGCRIRSASVLFRGTCRSCLEREPGGEEPKS